ncbi:MAG TPA: serine hydrolase domain-containing protein [Gemmatimonadaceae bacterium]|nr:serine hydrolase domain-containing protein [Gemmatimonadaceae bacterium]
MNGSLLGVVFAVMFAAAPLAAQRGAPLATPPAGWDAFTKLFDTNVKSDSIVGASVIIMRDGRVLAQHEYGMADRTLHQPVNDRTIYHWASITKTLTAIAVMQLRDRGKLSLDDRVTRYIPELRQVHDPYGSMDSITIRMLLSHSAGFQDATWLWSKGRPWEPFEPTTWNQLVAMMPYEQLLFKPGSQYSYSNPGFIYLARIIEQLTGDPWEAYIHKNIFMPLGLTHSYFRSTPYFLAADRSNNYTVTRDSTGKLVVHENGRDFDPGITTPNGGWNAPVSDLATYLAFLTNATHGDASTQRLYDTVLKRSSLEEMWKPLYSTSTGGYAPGDSVGLSFFITHRGGATIIGHTGSQAGFLSFMYFNPATSAAVIAAFNTNNETHGGESRGAFDTIRDAAQGLIEQ